MANKLEDFKLGSRCTIKSSKRIFAREYVDEGVPFFRSKDVIDKALGVFSGYEYFISQERFNELKKEHGSPEEGDLLLSSVGNRSGQPYVVRDEGDFYFKDGNIIWISEFNGVHPDFLAYWFKSRIGQSSLNSVMIGSAQKALTIDSIRNLKVSFPLYAIQKSIAHILGTLDDKIELNRHMNKTLEAMAQALFKSWFVDFDPVIDNALLAGKAIPEPLKERAEIRQAQLDSGKAKTDSEINDLFPSEFEFTEELGWIPKGWEIQKIKDFGLVVCGKTPSTRKAENYGEDVPFITIPDMHDSVYVIEPSKMLSKSGADSQKNKFLPKGTVCVSCIATPGLVVLVNEPSQTNQQINSIIPHNENHSLFLYESLSRLGDLIRSTGSGGSVFSNLSKSRFEALDLLNPSEESITKFSSILQPVFDKILANQRNNTSLSNIRDTLLPKLMSGELRIADAEKLVADS